MDFRELLISQFPDQERDATRGLPQLLVRLFAPLEFGESNGFGNRLHFIASIQASSMHHCQPEGELETHRYASFEVMLSELVKGKERILNPALDARFENHSWAEYWRHKRNYGAGATGIYVPVTEIQKMCDHLDTLCLERPQSSSEV